MTVVGAKRKTDLASYHQRDLNLDWIKKSLPIHSGHPLLYCAKFGRPLRVKREIFQTGENEGRAGSILRLQKRVLELLRRERGDHSFEARITSQRVPKHPKFSRIPSTEVANPAAWRTAAFAQLWRAKGDGRSLKSPRSLC